MCSPVVIPAGSVTVTVPFRTVAGTLVPEVVSVTAPVTGSPPLVTVTVALTGKEKGAPEPRVLRRALFAWAFNPATREAEGFGGSPLDRRMTFASFVVGRSNALAHASAMQVGNARPGEAPVYNPLYLHAAVGLGKTHLLQAAAHAAEAGGPLRLVLRFLPLEPEALAHPGGSVPQPAAYSGAPS